MSLPKIFLQKLDLVYSMTKATIKSRYRKTYAGFLWVILNPILTFAVQSIIFKHILKLNVENYYMFLLSGLIPWIFLTSTMNMTVSSFVVQRPILMAFKLDPWIFILSQTIDNLITFFASFVVLLVMNADIAVLSGFKLPMFIMASLLLFVASFFMSFIFATLHVFMRDTQFIMQFVLSLAYFVTPIFYPRELVPANFQWVVSLNPLYLIVKPFQSIFWKYNTEIFIRDYLINLGAVIILTIVCLSYWRKKKNELYFRI